MNRKLLIVIILLFAALFRLQAHPFNAAHYIVVDTDGGIDDYRALCLLLSAPDVRIIAVTASAGVLPAELAAKKARALLDLFHHEGIPVAINTRLTAKGMGCGPAHNFEWGNEEKLSSVDFLSLDSLGSWLQMNLKKKVTYIALGSLSTVISLHESFPELGKNTASVLWSSEAGETFGGFNNHLDTRLTDRLSSLPVPLTVVQGEGQYSNTFPERLNGIWSATAVAFEQSFCSTTAASPFGMRAYDEMTMLYLHYPESFDRTENAGIVRIQLKPATDFERLITNVLSEFNTQSCQIFGQFPTDKMAFQADLQPVADSILHLHGMQEWVSVVNTFELHRHIGVYALVGAKMGIRALEYFGAGIDEAEVLSLAGSGPPISCLNDGIQVSTGATLGHGLISVSEDNPRVAAVFTYMNQRVGFRLKEQYSLQIKTEIGQLVKQHGLESSRYWDEVRQLALRYWFMMDRHEMFEIVRLGL